MIDKRFGWWGKFVVLSRETRMVWIGPLSYCEMIKHFEEFRHNFRNAYLLPLKKDYDKH